MQINMHDHEFWFGGYVQEGINQPIGKDANYELDLRINLSPNQSMPLFLSTKGRYIWGDNGYKINFNQGIITLEGDVVVEAGFSNLRGAYLAAMKKHFPFNKIKLDPALFKNPIYNSWIELIYEQNQEDVLKYAETILESGMPPGVLMIDDGWTDYYGHWVFSKGKFPNPKEMIEKLKAQGFKVMLWVCPYVTPDTMQFRELRDLDLLIKTPEGKPFLLEWWNGYSAVLDFSNSKTHEWMDEKLEKLMELGVEGFKFDGGDSPFYDNDNVVHTPSTPDEQSLLWAKFGEKYPLNEYRITAKAGGMSLMQRLADKDHSWDRGGIPSLVPNSLMQGITGHPFCSPDMIGGGQYLNFIGTDDSALDKELFIRHSEIAALMPGMQFSAHPGRVLDEQEFTKVLDTIATRQKYQDKIDEAVTHAKETGEPILRYLTYEFPEEPVGQITDQFMLGSDILVAPAAEKGIEEREVYLPKGTWTFKNETINSKGEYRTFPCPLGQLIVIEKVD